MAVEKRAAVGTGFLENVCNPSWTRVGPWGVLEDVDLLFGAEQQGVSLTVTRGKRSEEEEKRFRGVLSQLKNDNDVVLQEFCP